MNVRRLPAGGLMVCGTSSDAGKTTFVTGLCRVLARRGLKVAPFKAQNMALNSMVTPGGAEIGRAQVAQAEAARVEPEASMNPILLKPTSHHSSEVVVMGRPWKNLTAVEYQNAKAELWPVVNAGLRRLRERFDVVVCEGAGSPAEINLLDHDLVNLRLASHQRLPAVLVGDIERGGVFATLYGTVALLPEELARCVRGFVINKFRGDARILEPGLEELEGRTGVPTLGVVPWLDGIEIDSEDSMGLRRFRHGSALHPSGAFIDVAVVALPRISNFTDLDALAIEPDVRVRFVTAPEMLGSPDLLILPGTKSTVADLDWLHSTGLSKAIVEVADPAKGRTTVLGICGGYQMLGEKIEDAVEAAEPRTVAGLGLLPVWTVFEAEKVTLQRTGTAFGRDIAGYEIHRGRTTTSDPWMSLDASPGGPARQEGGRSRDGKIFGTSLHGLLESDGFREAFLGAIAGAHGRARSPSGVSFKAARERRYDRIADVVEKHVDIASIERMIEESVGMRAGAPQR